MKRCHLLAFQQNKCYLCKMKLSFSLQYHTDWGQTLHIDIHYLCSDGHCMHTNLMMNTQDGEQWTLETSATASRTHRINSFQYVYQVQDREGKVLRREWDMPPRRYMFDLMTDYVFMDYWRDIPCHYHLYSAVCRMCTAQRSTEQSLNIETPIFRKTIVFRVSAPQLLEGERLGVCGNHPMLGNWHPGRYVSMKYVGQHDWILSFNADMVYAPIEFKYVLIDDKTNAIKVWEEGENRTTGVLNLTDGGAVVLYSQLRLAAPQWRIAGLLAEDVSVKTIDWAAKVGLKLIKLQPNLHKNARLTLSRVRHFMEMGRYARSKGIALMGHLCVEPEREIASEQIRRRFAFLAKMFDAISLEFSFPEDADRHRDYWTYLACDRLERTMQQTDMLVTIEQAYQLEYLAPISSKVDLISLKIHSKPEDAAHEFAHTDRYPWHSMAAVSTPNTTSLKAWWSEDYGRVQRYYVTILHKKGKAPRMLSATIAEEIIARHLFGPSAICLFTAEDVCLLDEMCAKGMSESNMLNADTLNDKLQIMIKRSKR